MTTKADVLAAMTNDNTWTEVATDYLRQRGWQEILAGRWFGPLCGMYCDHDLHNAVESQMLDDEL